MATISLLDVELVSQTQPELFVAAVDVVAGEVLFLDASDQGNLASNTDPSTDEIAVMALQDAVTGNQIVGIPTGAVIQVSNVLVIGDVYILAAVAGDVMLSNELLSTQFLSQFATVSATNQLTLEFNNTGDQKA